MTWRPLAAWGLSLCLALGLCACSGSAQSTDLPGEKEAAWRYPQGDAPREEYDRLFWYGFGQMDPDQDPSATITEKELVDMLTAVIAAREGDVAGWMELTAAASQDNEVYRAYGAMLLLYAAEEMEGATQFTDGYAPYFLNFSDAQWTALYEDNRGGYPLVEEIWDQTCVSISSQRGENVEMNYHNASQDFVFCRLSQVTGAPLMDFDYASSTLRLTDPMTYEEGAVAAVRLFESFSDVADWFPGNTEDREAAAQLLEEAWAKRDAIWNDDTQIVRSDTFRPGETYTGTAYYLSNDGDDTADGTSPETAWATIERLNKAQLRYGDAVFFRRGDVWREVQVQSWAGVTYSAYGEGAKPGLYGSPEDGSGAEKWTLWYEGENGEKIWLYHRDMLDCGAIALGSQGETAAKKVAAFWNGEQYLVCSKLWNQGDDEAAREDQMSQPAFDVAAELTEDLTFFSQADSTLPDTLPVYLLGWMDSGQEEFYCMTASGPLYLRCDQGNPGEVYDQIEFLTPHAQFDGIQDDVVLDNLDLRYTGRDLVSVAPQCEGVLIQNCALGWGGGCVASYALDTITGYGAGNQRNGGVGGASSSGNTFRNNYVYESYQEGLGLEAAVEFGGGVEDLTDNLFEGNVFYHCSAPLLYFNWDMEANPNHQFRNIVFTGNYVLFSGYSDWTDLGTAFCSQGGPNMQDGTVKVTDNLFFAAEYTLLYVETYVPEYLPDFAGNRYVQMGGSPLLLSANTRYYCCPDAQGFLSDFLKDESGEALTVYPTYFS